MLKQRVITGVAMAGSFLLAVMFLPLPALALLFALIVAAGGWEWAHLAGIANKGARAVYALLLLAMMAGLYVYIDRSMATPTGPVFTGGRVGRAGCLATGRPRAGISSSAMTKNR